MLDFAKDRVFYMSRWGRDPESYTEIAQQQDMTKSIIFMD